MTDWFCKIANENTSIFLKYLRGSVYIGYNCCKNESINPEFFKKNDEIGLTLQPVGHCNYEDHIEVKGKKAYDLLVLSNNRKNLNTYCKGISLFYETIKIFNLLKTPNQ